MGPGAIVGGIIAAELAAKGIYPPPPKGLIVMDDECVTWPGQDVTCSLGTHRCIRTDHRESTD